MELNKTYTPSEIEDKWYARWAAANIFRSTPDERPAYTIVIPPPNVTGVLHMGHMLNNTIQDVLIRRKRMEGYNACWVPGTDHASIATEAKVVQLLAKQGIKKTDIGRDAFLQHAFEWKDKYGGIILQQLRKLGASCDWERTRFTMDADYYRDVIKVFCDLYDKGLIYRGVRMVNWDPVARTAVSDEEVLQQPTRSKLYQVRYPIEGMEGQYIEVATTRPETIMGDVAIAVHPEDERYKHLHGKFALVPMVNRRIPIITDEALDKEFGTGCLKVTPAHDIVDYEIGLRHNLPVIDVLNEDGTIADVAVVFVGMDRFDARKAVPKRLAELGLLVKEEDYNNTVGYSERTNAVIEPRLSLQWFLKMEDITKPALEAVLNGEVNLIPGKYVNTYRHWMENVRDWCLSRQLWWGHRIPAYYIKGGNDFVVAASLEDALVKAKAKTGDASLTAADLSQDEDVLDTWASSWLWPISVFDGMENPENPDFKYYYPTNDLVTAPEILFFWVARMIMAGKEYTQKSPFQNVYLTGIVRDKQRRKMSKSLGNSPDPLDLIEKFGADSVRMGMLLCSPAGNDILYDDSLVEQGRNFANKIWNAFRLVKGWTADDDIAPSASDALALAWMQARIADASVELADLFSKFRLSEALMSVYKLIWDDFCAWYLEWIKPAYGQPISAKTLDGATAIFEELMHLLHPFMPFLTEELWHGLRPRAEGEFLAAAQFSTSYAPNPALTDAFALAQEVISEVRNFRAAKGLSPKEALSLAIKTDENDVFVQFDSVLAKFLNLDAQTFVAEKPAGTVSLRVRTHELYLPLPTMDVAAERAKIEAEITYIEGFMQSVAVKLSNEKFMANAKPEVIAIERKKAADAQTKLDLLRQSLAELA